MDFIYLIVYHSNNYQALRFCHVLNVYANITFYQVCKNVLGKSKVYIFVKKYTHPVSLCWFRVSFDF